MMLKQFLQALKRFVFGPTYRYINNPDADVLRISDSENVVTINNYYVIKRGIAGRTFLGWPKVSNYHFGENKENE